MAKHILWYGVFCLIFPNICYAVLNWLRDSVSPLSYLPDFYLLGLLLLMPFLVFFLPGLMTIPATWMIFCFSKPDKRKRACAIVLWGTPLMLFIYGRLKLALLGPDAMVLPDTVLLTLLQLMLKSF